MYYTVYFILYANYILTLYTHYIHYIYTEPTAVLAISKSALEEVYYENKTKLCEIRIRQVGKNVELQHVIDHPRGSEAFKKYLIKAMAVENLLFYLAVDRFDSMCLTVSKMFTEVRKYRNKIENNQCMIAEQQQLQTLSGTEHHFIGIFLFNINISVFIIFLLYR